MGSKNKVLKSVVTILSFWMTIFYCIHLHSTEMDEMIYESVEDETFEEIINSEMEDASKESVVLGLFEFYVGNLEKSVSQLRSCKKDSDKSKCAQLKKQCKNSLAFVDSADKTSSWITKHIAPEPTRAIASIPAVAASTAELKFSKDENKKLKVYMNQLEKFKGDVASFCGK